MQFIVENPDQLQQVALELIKTFGDHKVFLFYGNMGAGKTTLIKAICQGLGVEDNTSSPTFSIVNEYASSHGPIYHFDFYRLRDEQEALDMGYEEYFYSRNYCFVEWPEKIPNLIPEDIKTIKIEILTPLSRQIEIF